MKVKQEVRLIERNRAVDGVRLEIDDIIQERIDDGWRVVAMTGELDLARVLVVFERQVGE